jgi:hypothetical protein
VIIPKATEAFDEVGEPVNPVAEINLGITLGDLKMMARRLEAARAKGRLPLPPSGSELPLRPSTRSKTKRYDGGRRLGCINTSRSSPDLVFQCPTT